MAYATGAMKINAPLDIQRERGADEEEIRAMSLSGAHPGIRERAWGMATRLDKGVTFEEYQYFAKAERAMEEYEYQQYRENTPNKGFMGALKAYFSNHPYEDTASKVVDAPTFTLNATTSDVMKPSGSDEIGSAGSQEMQTMPQSADEKQMLSQQDKVPSDDDGTSPIAPAYSNDISSDWRTASRALRTAGWGSMFYLITTDILGWGATPNVFAQTGYNYGVGIFVLMGVAAGAAGLMLWQTFLKLDSSRYPIVGFGDPFHRLFGPKTRNAVNFMQAFQQFLTVAILIFGQSSLLSQMANAKICWIAVLIITMVIGISMSWLRSLKHMGWLCNFAVWINVANFVIVMIAAAKYGPDVTITVQTTLLNKAWLTNPAPVKTFFSVPPAEYQQNVPDPSTAVLQGVNSMVYSYSGALLFMAFMSEMRRPMDFWKATILAQTFITVVYIFFGVFVYAYYGQYAASTITQSVMTIAWQYASNALALVTGYLAIFLYFNVGFKTVYIEVGQEIFHLPSITTKKGRWLWIGLGPVYWILALVVAASIPSFNGIVGVVGGLLSLNFTYSIPGIMYCTYLIQEGAQLPGEGFDPATGITTRHDSGMKRWARGFMKKWYLTVPVALYSAGGLAASGLGTWSAVLSLIGLLGPGGTIQTSWGCTAIG